ncbi:MAG: phosphoribosylformylglycinamidine synthase subunit PurS [Chloroflexi bacterium]|nr:phosphoribosylformylglycinamidine synthase subunit PurS [Chloroflexota bacterium]
MQFSAQVHVTLKPTVNDPQGNAVLGSLHTLGFESVRSVRVGKYLTLALEASDEQDASSQVDAMCERLLANTVIESYETSISPA